MIPLMGAVGQTDVSVKATLDSSRIFIGGQINLTLEVSQPNGLTVKFPVYKDTITKSVEVVTIGKIETVSKGNGRTNLIQKIRITSFDSGLHYISPINFEVWGKVSKTIQSTEGMGLNVVNPFNNVDPKKGVFDIKTVIDTPWVWSELWNYLPWVLLALAIIGGLIWLIFYLRKHQSPLVSILQKEKPKDPPYIVAIRELERIRNEKAWQKNQEKRFYTEITDVLRIYIEERFAVLAMESTTDELVKTMKANKLVDSNTLRDLQAILEEADLVKFAKYIPRVEDNDKNLTLSQHFVEVTKPVEVEPLLKAETSNDAPTDSSSNSEKA